MSHTESAYGLWSLVAGHYQLISVYLVRLQLHPA